MSLDTLVRMGMMWRKDFRRYWKAGLLFVVVSSLTYGLLNYVSSLFSSLPLQTIYEAGPITVTIHKQPEWTVLLFLFLIAVFSVLPWAYGRLIEIFHNKYIAEKKT